MPPNDITPISFLREAVRAVPAVKWALGVGGIMAVIAIIYTFQISPRVAVIGTLVMLIFMGVLVVFARVSALGDSALALPALVFTWFVLLIFMAGTLALFSSVFFQQPLPLRSWLVGEPKPADTVSTPPPQLQTDNDSAACDGKIDGLLKEIQDHNDPYDGLFASIKQAGCGKISASECKAVRATQAYQVNGPNCPNCSKHGDFAKKVGDYYSCP